MMIFNQETNSAPLAGFANPVDDGQSVFRAVLDAMSHPGKIVSLNNLDDAPEPLNNATAAICLSLVDYETPLWADSEIAASSEAVNFLRFHCGCPITSDSMEARTALISDGKELATFERFFSGTDERPDLSATLIVQVDELSDNGGIKLSGPGIKKSTTLNVVGLDGNFWMAVQENHGLFPRGVDLILSASDQIVCLPRTTKIET